MAKQDASFGKTCHRVYERLRSRVLAPEARVGDQLPTMQQLSQEFGVSRPTVLRAIDRLEEEGLVRGRRGSGCYITAPVSPLSLDESVLLCMEGRGHTWGELTGLIARRLQNDGLFTTLIDTSPGMKIDPLLERAAYSHARCILVHGHRHFHIEKLRPALERGKIVLAAGEWDIEADWPEVSGVVTDASAGGRKVCEHLWSRGHRRVVLAATEDQIDRLRRGLGPGREPPTAESFLTCWADRGGSCEMLACDIASPPPDREPFTEAERAIELLSDAGGGEPATAVFGTMDACTYAVQRAVRDHAPHRLHHIEWMGYFDTPWAQAGNPPFSTVSVEPRPLADRLAEVVRTVLTSPSDAKRPAREYIEPKLVLREDPEREPPPGVPKRKPVRRRSRKAL